jgi:hypothetical protein
LAVILLAIIVLSYFGTHTEIDGKWVPNPTSTPSMMKIIGEVVGQPAHHSGGQGMDVRVKVESAKFASIDLIGTEPIVLLDPSANQLKEGDKITLYCQMNTSPPRALEYCDFDRILGE